jgi:methionine-rich copper-binding protein CopC
LRLPLQRWLSYCERIDVVRNVVLRGSLLALLCLALGAGPASAHASLVGSDPEDGASVATSPASITLTFNENIGNPAYVVVRAPDGTTLKVSDVSAVDTEVKASIESVDQKGRYTATFRVVSADGHPVEGTIHWTATTGRAVKQVDPPKENGFVHRHRAHLFWGILAAAVAIALLLAPLRGRDDQNNP